MGLLNTAIKKSEAKLGTTGTSADERKILLNINSRIEDLKNQNAENARFLKGISKRIEDELVTMKGIEENKTVEVFDDSEILDSIERIEQSINGMNNDEVLNAIQRINDSISTSAESKEKVSQEDIENLRGGIISLGDNMEKLSTGTDRLEENVNQIKDSTMQLGDDVNWIKGSTVQLENDINRLKDNTVKLDEFTVGIKDEISLVNTKIERITNNDVLEELQKIEYQLKNGSQKDYSDKLQEIKQLLEQNKDNQDELKKKVDRISTMPNTLRSMMEQLNNDNLAKIEEKIQKVTDREKRVNEKLTKLININLWVSIFTLILFIAKVMGKL
ncbi:MAG: hypothetical protein IIT48_02750 [Lachnospiraceae bacterium]|nr:hypothetical protein [Lachnospiraceae bacterium]